MRAEQAGPAGSRLHGRCARPSPTEAKQSRVPGGEGVGGGMREAVSLGAGLGRQRALSPRDGLFLNCAAPFLRFPAVRLRSSLPEEYGSSVYRKLDHVDERKGKYP